nr:Gag-Pol polyprotein [Tanacetum cinerariifolium]
MSETFISNDTSGLVPQRKKASDYDNSDPIPQLHNVSSSADEHVPAQQELDLLVSPLYDEFFSAGYNLQDIQPITNIRPTSAPSTPTYVHAEENNDHQVEEEHLPDDEFTNPFCTQVQDVVESSSHSIEQVCGNPSRPVQTRRQLVTDPEMCMFALTVNTAERKNIKESIADSAWIEVMQEEIHQFDRLQVWELVEKPFGKIVIRLKWLWKNKKDEDQTVIRNKARLVAKGCIDTRKSTSGGIQFLSDKLVSWMSKKQDCTAMSSAEAEYVALSAKLCSSNVDENITSRLWPPLKQNTIVLRLSVWHSNLMQPRTVLPYQAHPYSVSLHKGTALPEDRFKYLVRRIVMRCLTPAELEVLAKESA